MKFSLKASSDVHWIVLDESGAACGELSRLATGYLATRTEDKKIVKRFRMIDALRETFGEENQYETE